MSENEDEAFREALNRSAKVVSDLPEILQPTAFSVVFPLIYTRNPGGGGAKTRVPARTAKSPATPRRQSAGPKPAIERLRSEGFFGTPRTVEELSSAIKDGRGQAFEGRMLSTALLRMLRSGVLERSRTPAGEYAYRETQ
jgi:hypothetical protein